jgi:hypothetical protein
LDSSRIWKPTSSTLQAKEAAPELPATLKAALLDLARWTGPGADLELLRQRVETILKAAFTTHGAPIPSLEPGAELSEFLQERIREGWSQGVPAVRVVPPAIACTRLHERVRSLDRAMAGWSSVPAERFRELVRDDPAQIATWAQAMLAEGEEYIRGSLEQLGVQPDYAFSILRLTLLGELGEWSGRVSSLLSETSWPRCDCPVCGRAPALAESRGLGQRRYLSCSCCGAGWPSDRMRCPFCGQADHWLLQSLFAEQDQDRCRLAVCDGCGGRLKVITTLAPLSAPGLVVAEFTMLYLDFIDDPRDVHEMP